MHTRKLRKTLIGLSAGLLLALAVPAQAGVVNDVDMVSFTFVAPVTVAATDDPATGERFVDFDNLDPVAHHPKALNACLDAGVIASGSTGRANLSGCANGEIQYRCEIHTFMTGIVVKQ